MDLKYDLLASHITLSRTYKLQKMSHKNVIVSKFSSTKYYATQSKGGYGILSSLLKGTMGDCNGQARNIQMKNLTIIFFNKTRYSGEEFNLVISKLFAKQKNLLISLYLIPSHSYMIDTTVFLSSGGRSRQLQETLLVVFSIIHPTQPTFQLSSAMLVIFRINIAFSISISCSVGLNGIFNLVYSRLV